MPSAAASRWAGFSVRGARMPGIAMVSMVTFAPQSVSARRDAWAERAIGSTRSSLRLVIWPTPTKTGVLGSTELIA